MKKITAKFNSKCAETGKPIRKGEEMYYNYNTRKCYSLQSNEAQQYNSVDNAAGMIQANEEAYFDNFCYRNNI